MFSIIKKGRKMQIGVKFLRIGSSGGLLWTVMNHQVP